MSYNSVALDVPFGPPTDSYAKERIDLRLDANQARIMRRLIDAVSGRHERLANGKHVDEINGTVKWLIERIGAAAEAAGAKGRVAKGGS